MATRFHFMSMKASRLSCKVTKGSDVLNRREAFESQQESCSRFASDMSKETHDGCTLRLDAKAARQRTALDAERTGMPGLTIRCRRPADGYGNNTTLESPFPE